MCPWQGRIHRSSAYYTAGVWQHAILIFVKFSVVICIFRRCTFEGHTGCGNFSCLIHVGPTLLDVSKLRFNLLNYSMLMKLSEEEKINGFLASKVKEEGLIIHTALPSQYLYKVILVDFGWFWIWDEQACLGLISISIPYLPYPFLLHQKDDINIVAQRRDMDNVHPFVDSNISKFQVSPICA